MEELGACKKKKKPTQNKKKKQQTWIGSSKKEYFKLFKKKCADKNTSKSIPQNITVNLCVISFVWDVGLKEHWKMVKTVESFGMLVNC